MTERMTATSHSPAFTSTVGTSRVWLQGVECMGGVPLPEGYHSVNPYIVADDADRLIDFLVQVFAGVEQGRACARTAASTTAMSASGTPWCC